MYIAVDAGCLGVKDKRLKVGVYTVVKNFLIELGKIDKNNKYLLYSFHPIEKSLLKEFGLQMQNIVLPAIGWLKVGLPIRLLLDKPDIFIAANQAIPFKLPLSSYKTLGIFYDIAFEKYPELYSYAASVSKHRINSRYLAENAESLIAISESTKKDLVDLYKIPKGRITVAYPGINPEVRSKKQEARRENPYFLFVGAFKKSKNISTLLLGFNIFLQSQAKKYDLLLVGGDKWLDPEIERVMSTFSAETKKHVKNLGFVDNKKLASLYKSAVAFVSPSLYEGFGLPFIEAQSLGCPIIGSQRGSLPEIIGKSGILIDPKNSNQLAQALKTMTNSSSRKRYIQQGKINAKKYSWKSFAKQVQSALQSLS